MTKHPLTRHSSLTTRLLITGGAIGPLLFILVFLIEGATRPDYSAWHQVVSDLSLGPDGWMQIANFLQCGLLLLGFALGLRQVLRSGKGALWGPLLLSIGGVALILSGLFVTDPSLGYPPGTTTSGLPTLHGAIHSVAGVILFGSVAAASVILARRFAGDPAWRGWAGYSLTTGIIVAGVFIVMDVVLSLDQQHIFPASPTGLLQRIAIIAGWGWIALLAFRLLGHIPASAPSARSAESTGATDQVDQAQGLRNREGKERLPRGHVRRDTTLLRLVRARRRNSLKKDKHYRRCFTAAGRMGSLWSSQPRLAYCAVSVRIEDAHRRGIQPPSR